MFLCSLKRAASAMVIAALLIAVLAPTASASVPAKISSSSAKIYQSASTSAKSVKAPKDLKVSITAISGSWAKVSYKGKSAYMPLSSLSMTQKAAGYATKSTAVYNSSGKKVGTMSAGTAVYVRGTLNGYYCVTNKSGDMGFVKTGAISDEKPASSGEPAVTNISERALPKGSKSSGVTEVESSGSARKATGIDKALVAAMKALGTPYSLGDASKGFNCSSFVRYCMGKGGYSMKDTAAAQAADSRYPEILSVSDLKRGDVLFFDTSGDGKVDHTGIYLGSSRFVEASQKAGEVQINTLSSWYKSHFTGARRPA